MVSGSLSRLAGEAVGAAGWSFPQIAQRLSPAVSKFQVSRALNPKAGNLPEMCRVGGAGAVGSPQLLVIPLCCCLVLHLLLQEVVADRASGCYVWTTDGRKHLDFASGIGGWGAAGPAAFWCFGAQGMAGWLAGQPGAPCCLACLLNTATSDTGRFSVRCCCCCCIKHMGARFQLHWRPSAPPALLSRRRVEHGALPPTRGVRHPAAGRGDHHGTAEHPARQQGHGGRCRGCCGPLPRAVRHAGVTNPAMRPYALGLGGVPQSPPACNTCCLPAMPPNLPAGTLLLPVPPLVDGRGLRRWAFCSGWSASCPAA